MKLKITSLSTALPMRTWNATEQLSAISRACWLSRALLPWEDEKSLAGAMRRRAFNVANRKNLILDKLGFPTHITVSRRTRGKANMLRNAADNLVEGIQ